MNKPEDATRTRMREKPPQRKTQEKRRQMNGKQLWRSWTLRLQETKPETYHHRPVKTSGRRENRNRTSE
ncbi:hypothetical protein NDU88_006281 [Pleurodeles waltl]|uniref:Uncharacterized protein n=1 Tax=Pleurodeles waltl TaxID=8319 RepID=A0AAV7PQ68_PLEWA|nr:hypothetical protein NDU88_006281 [Pleurodeles waltl]